MKLFYTFWDFISLGQEVEAPESMATKFKDDETQEFLKKIL